MISQAVVAALALMVAANVSLLLVHVGVPLHMLCKVIMYMAALVMCAAIRSRLLPMICAVNGHEPILRNSQVRFYM